MTMTTPSAEPDDPVDPSRATTLGSGRADRLGPRWLAAFYEQAIGLRASDRDDGTVALARRTGARWSCYTETAPRRGWTAAPPGLYHLAILLPTRLDLAFALARLAEARWPLDGASDHLVYEALYLSDPDGNGIEIYRDRPRDEWRYDNGALEMSTLPLDLRDVLGELAGGDGPQPTAPPAPRSATSISRSPTSPRPRRSTTACSGST